MPRPDPPDLRTAKMAAIDRILEQSVYEMDSKMIKQVRFDLSRLSFATVQHISIIVAQKVRDALETPPFNLNAYCDALAAEYPRKIS